MPWRLTRPKVGFSPTVPQKLAGMRIEPPVSEPMPIGTSPAATAAPLPPLLPPGMRSRSQGLAVGGLTVPQANSCVRVLPISTQPAARRRSAQAESASCGKAMPAAVVPAVVGWPRVR